MKKAFSAALSFIIMISVICGIHIDSYAASLSAPTDVSITVKSSTKVNISWKKVKNAKKYYIYRSSKANRGYKKVASTTKTKAEIKNLKKGKTYYFKIKAVKGSSISTDSAVVANWGSIKNAEFKAYSVADHYSWETEGPGFAGFTVRFNKVPGADGYQYKQIYYGRTVTKSVKSNKWCFGTQEGIGTIKARAYKKVNGKKVYGPWKTVAGDNMYQDYSDQLYSEDWENITSEYTYLF